MEYKLEICATSFESARNAQNGGAHRIELCDNLYEGGTTPSIGLINQVCKHLSIDVNVLIRPRGGDFVYSGLEYETLKEDIHFVKSIGVHGIVVGFLHSDGSVDTEKLNEIVTLSQPLSVTFHRAFDMVKNPKQALEDIIECGCDRILTSGQQKTAEVGTQLILELITQANGRISIMPGSGINVQNIQKIALQTNAKEFHLSAKSFRNSAMNYRNQTLSMNAFSQIPEYDILYSDENIIKEIVKILNAI